MLPPVDPCRPHDLRIGDELTVKPSKKFAKRLKQIKGLKLSVKLSASDAFANRDVETLGAKLRTK